MTFTKILVARHSPENRSYAETGELLSFASPNDRIKRRLPKAEHFFVGLNSRQGARYGWVALAEKPITPEELKRADEQSQLKVLGAIGESPLDLYETLLATIDRFEPGTPMAAAWLDVVGMDATVKRKMQFHRVFFRGGTDDE